MTTIRPLVPPDRLRSVLGERAPALEEMVAEVAADPGRIGRVFPAAARRTARGPVPGHEAQAEDAVRVELVSAAAAGLTSEALLEELRALYRFGDSDEKRAVLEALNSVEDPGLDGSDLALDALRTNDTRLVGAAMGAHATRLPDDAWRHGVLKCLFTGVPVARVAGLRERADAELAAMAGRFARERQAAGRDVPADVTVVIDACPPTAPTEPTPHEA